MTESCYDVNLVITAGPGGWYDDNSQYGHFFVFSAY